MPFGAAAVVCRHCGLKILSRNPELLGHGGNRACSEETVASLIQRGLDFLLQLREFGADRHQDADTGVNALFDHVVDLRLVENRPSRVAELGINSIRGLRERHGNVFIDKAAAVGIHPKRSRLPCCGIDIREKLNAFAFRDFRPRLARLLLALALLSGFAAGFARVVVGAHFPSHVFAALALDWLISAGLYIAAFDRAGLARKLRALLPFGRRSTEDQPGRVTLYLFTSLWWAIVFNGPMTAKLAIDNNLVTTDSLILSLGTTAAFAFVSAAIIELCGLLPKMVFRILLLILNTLGAAAFAAAYLYGTAMTPDMVRNFLATDPAEAQAYLSTRSVLLFLAAWLPPMLVTLAANLKKSASSARPTLLRRLLVFLRRLFTSIGFAAVGVALIGLNFQAFAGAMRNDKSLRYMIAPVNVVYSGMRTIVGDSSPETNAPRVAVDPSPSLAVKPSRPAVLFLHMMGSHGPAYSLRSDKARKLFEPECTDADLKSCSRESVMNAYDNSVRETDYVLASLIRMLKDTSGSIDSALVYVSDHGESLGEGGLYLHGAPYWMAPKEQTEVPMVLWMNPGFEKTFSINRSKLEKNAAGRVTHENLYHTVLGLLNVKSTTYVPTYDLTH